MNKHIYIMYINLSKQGKYTNLTLHSPWKITVFQDIDPASTRHVELTRYLCETIMFRYMGKYVGMSGYIYFNMEIAILINVNSAGYLQVMPDG